MLEIRMRDGKIFDPFDADVKIKPKGQKVAYGWGDILVLGMLEPTYDVIHGSFAPPGVTGGMPIRGVRFTDLSDFAVEIPMPVPVAREMGQLLGETDIEVVKSMPSTLLLRQGPLLNRAERRAQERRR